ncbi:LexA family protein [Pseudanabaena sp. PCC 6802]|uniref:LexA family protein n=1 Tax=Pseudanabaena sp. PCC 6802 TaxID=118173 RepID=UPI000347ACCA|nr:translesion error-prone DNA polymerase V autoproteolytic subunit [Pseudanabaena sp. PCC 6802]
MTLIPLDIDFSALIRLPLYLCPVSAGLPSKADDYVERYIDVPRWFVEHPSNTFAVRVSGDSMIGAGLCDGDIVLVDSAIEPTHDKIVVALIDGEETIKRLYMHDGQVKLVPENPNYDPISIHPETDCTIQGAIVWMLRSYV